MVFVFLLFLEQLHAFCEECIKNVVNMSVKWIWLTYFKNQHAYDLTHKEGNVLFNDALNTFYLRLYGVGHMIKDHSDSERGKPVLPHRLLFPISSKGSFICTTHRQDNTYHSLCYTSRGALVGTRNNSMGPLHEGSIQQPFAPWANALTTELRLIH